MIPMRIRSYIWMSVIMSMMMTALLLRLAILQKNCQPFDMKLISHTHEISDSFSFIFNMKLNAHAKIDVDFFCKIQGAIVFYSGWTRVPRAHYEWR